MATKGKPFVKGRSGNPGGRPRIPEDVKDLARSYTAEAIETAAKIMRDKAQTGSARMAAVNTILDRAWGKPPQHITTENLEALSDDEIRAELAAALTELRRHGIDPEGRSPHGRGAAPKRTH